MTGTTLLGRWTTGGTALLLAAALGACTSDDGGDGTPAADAGTSATEGTGAPTSEPTGAAGSGDVVAFCEALVDVEAAFGADIEVADRVVPEEARVAALEEWNATLRRQMRVVQGTAPAQLSQEVDALSRIVYDALTYGSLTAAQEEEGAAVDDALDEYQLAECADAHVEATGVDYAYAGLPATMPPGVVAITFTNQGTEPHEVFLARLDDDVTMPAGQVMAQPEEQLWSMMAPVGRSMVVPGDSETTFVRTDPGRYVVACLVPQGTTPDGEGGGPPHHALGMVAEFTVG
jgi:hypothetical protein